MAEMSRHARHARRSHLPGRTTALVVAAVALVVVGAAAGYLIGRTGTSAPAASSVSPAPPASPAPAASSSGLPSPGSPAPPTVLGDVARIVAGDEIVVRSGGNDMTVRVLGLSTPAAMSTDPGGSTAAACGSREALQFADSRLSGQSVTLVPDPTIPDVDDQGRRLAYVVLRSQLNYTDAALTEGIGRADASRPLWYADVFAREQRDAVDGGRGIWGAPCRERP